MMLYWEKTAKQKGKIFQLVTGILGFFEGFVKVQGITAEGFLTTVSKLSSLGFCQSQWKTQVEHFWKAASYLLELPWHQDTKIINTQHENILV